MLLSVQIASSQVLISLLFGDKLNSDAIEFGLEGGFNFSDLGALDANKRLTTFNLGFYFDIELKDAWRLYTGVLVKSKLGVENLSDADLLLLGVNPDQEGGTYSQYINNFLVPALIKYRFPSRIYAEAGPQFGLLYKSWVQFDSDVDGTETRIRIENKDVLNTFEVGGVIGAGYRLRPGPAGMTLGIKYYQGFTNAIKGLSGSRNNAIFLKFNVPIGAGKKRENTD
ncbi:MAG: PorT family protein [Flavobacteriaceae bacterium]|nr:MAG: PorT family protein [Flavobacteriaceae bacterium]